MDSKQEFNLYNKITYYISYIRKHVIINIPKIHNDIRIHLLDESYNLVKLLRYASWNTGNIRNKYITEMLISISMLDYLTSNLSSLSNINKKKIENSFGMLASIRNITYAWKVNEENEKKNR